MVHIKISSELGQKIMNNLAAQPYNAVFQIIDEFTKSEIIEEITNPNPSKEIKEEKTVEAKTEEAKK